jgi:hypothetical protein
MEKPMKMGFSDTIREELSEAFMASFTTCLGPF